MHVFKIEVRSRWMAAMSLIVGLLAVAVLLIALPAGSSRAADPEVYSGHVVVRFADADTAVRPITWTGTISRVVALQRAGFSVENSGDAVCSINGEGCPSDNCFCPDNLWAQGVWADTAWDSAAWPPPVLVDGDIVAFRMGTQSDYSDWGLAGFLPGAVTFVAASDALEWMRGQQQADGSYGDAFGAVGASARTLLVLGAAGYDPAHWGSPNLLDFMTVVSRTETADYAASSAAAAGKLALAAAWTGQDVADFAGVNLPISLTATFSPTTGAFGAGSGDTAWAVLGLYAMGEPIPTEAIAFLKSTQNADGGWAWNEWGADSETQHTAACVQALLAAGQDVRSAEIASALAFIADARNEDGGYPYMSSGPSDVGSSAYALQTLLSAGQDLPGNWCSSVQGAFLLAAQQEDGSYGGYSALYSTQEVIPALMHRPLGPLAEWSYNCYAGYVPIVAKEQ